MKPATVLERGAMVALRLLLIGACIYGGVLAFHALEGILLPILFALLLTALLAPAVSWLDRHHSRHGLSVFVVVIGLLAFIFGAIAWITPPLVSQAGEAATQAQAGIGRLPRLLESVGVGRTESHHLIAQATDKLQHNVGAIGATVSSSALDVASAGVSVAFGAFLTLVLLTYLLSDGDTFWLGAVRLLSADRRPTALLAGRRAAHALIIFVRSQVAVAAMDALGIGIGLVALGIPLVLPLTVLTFVLSFVPYVGATVSGLLIALVALSTQGFATMAAIIAVAIGVQMIEGHLVYPMLVGRNLKLHPITVLLAVGTGAALLGILGAFFATPLLAAVAAAGGLLPDQLDDAERAATDVEMQEMADADERDAEASEGDGGGSPVDPEFNDETAEPSPAH
jgi:predicted PurR-regulated permease PerM